jgi:prepilin-type N-terminal cleavage/methylation domain-containing protein
MTLIEVVITLAIAGILASVALPRLSRSLAMHRLDTAADRVAADLGRARQRAMTQADWARVFFRPSRETYLLYDVETNDRTVDLGGEPYRADLYTAAFGDDTTVSFDGFGVPAPADAGYIILRGTDQYRQILVSAAGEVSVLKHVTLGFSPQNNPEVVP